MTAGAQGQSYVITPADTLIGTAPFDQISIHDIWQTNVSADTIILKWTLIDNGVLATWDYSLCELGTCFPGIPDSGTMDPVPPGEQGFLGLNINPYQVTGTGTARIYVYDAAYPNDGDTLTWIISAGTVGIAAAVQDFRISPNPVQRMLHIETGSEASCTITNMNGDIVINHQGQSQNPIDVSALPPAIYVITIVTDGKVSTGKFVKSP